MSNELQQSQIKLTAGSAPWFSLPAKIIDPQTIHVSAANGFTAASYHSFIKHFDGQYAFTGMDCRGSWPETQTPPESFNMHDFADDLIEGLTQQHDQPVIGLGHSQGGLVTLLAAIKRPELFSKLVLIEPASLPHQWIDYLYPYIPKYLLYRFFPFMEGSLNRQRIWQSKEAFYQRYRHHNTYQRFTDESFDDYMNHGLKNSQENWELTFSPEWEAHIFRKVEFIWKYLTKVRIPTYFIKAEHSNLYSYRVFQKQNKKLSKIISTTEVADTYHLLPHEKPERCANLVVKWLEKDFLSQ